MSEGSMLMPLLNRLYTMYSQDLEVGDGVSTGWPRGSWEMVGVCWPTVCAPMERRSPRAEPGVCVLLAGGAVLSTPLPRRRNGLCSPVRLPSIKCACACVIVMIRPYRAASLAVAALKLLSELWRWRVRVLCGCDALLLVECACDALRVGFCCVNFRAPLLP